MSIDSKKISELLELNKLDIKEENTEELIEELHSMEVLLSTLEDYSMDKDKDVQNAKDIKELREDRAVKDETMKINELSTYIYDGFLSIPSIFYNKEQ